MLTTPQLPPLLRLLEANQADKWNKKGRVYSRQKIGLWKETEETYTPKIGLWKEIYVKLIWNQMQMVLNPKSLRRIQSDICFMCSRRCSVHYRDTNCVAFPSSFLVIGPILPVGWLMSFEKCITGFLGQSLYLTQSMDWTKTGWVFNLNRYLVIWIYSTQG